jgi:DNA adenine methylase
MKKQMKAPMGYYGGKTQLLDRILPIIPPHKIYSESFFGGGAVYFAKEPAKIEIINDVNRNVINFYKTAKRQFKALKSEIDVTLYSEEQYHEAKTIYNETNRDNQDKVLRAWSLFVLSNQTFLNILDNTWAFSKDRNVATTFQNKKENFDKKYVKRLEHTQIFSRDAIRVIKNTDTEETFHFVDPPYINTDCGHYRGYSETDFKELLNALETVKGKFLLTSFPSEILDSFTAKNNWHRVEIIKHKSASGKAGITKTEVFTANYPIH